MSLHNTYHIMRHGESEANQAGLIISSPAKGIARYGLTEKGRAMAEKSLALAGFSPPVTRIISSDFRRALETARLAAAALGIKEVETSELLRERFFGSLDGGSDNAYTIVWEEDRKNPGNTSQGVESPRQVEQRILSLFRELEKRFIGESILLVSHGDTLQIIQCITADGSPHLHREVPHLNPAEIRTLRPDNSFLKTMKKQNQTLRKKI